MAITKDEFEQIVRFTAEQLGDKLEREMLTDTVLRVLKQIKEESNVSEESETQPEQTDTPEKIIITVLGRNQPEILSKTMSVTASQKLDIIDISQNCLQEFYLLNILVNRLSTDFDIGELENELASSLSELGTKFFISYENELQ